jgi:subtilisin family serine protease
MAQKLPCLLLLLFIFNGVYSSNVAVFDSGLNNPMRYILREGDHIDFTGENIIQRDTVRHGTRVSGTIAGTNPECPGLASNTAIIHAYKIFDSVQEARTEWILDAFNHAMYAGIDVINLSMGDTISELYDIALRSKIQEVAANGIVIVAAVGNDGPLENTVRSPADMACVISVGSLALNERSVADFSSRGTKVDVLAPGHLVNIDTLDGKCHRHKGTSISTPIVTSIVDLVVERFSAIKRRQWVNVASVKQLLIAGAIEIPGTEGCAGRVDANRTLALVDTFSPYLSVFPVRALYTHEKVIVVTLLNSVTISSRILSVAYEDENVLAFEYPEYVWPWTCAIKIHIIKLALRPCRIIFWVAQSESAKQGVIFYID